MSERLRYLSPDFQERKNRQPFQCSIYMGKHSVNIYSEMDHFLPYFEGLGVDYIPSFPGWKVSKNPSVSEYSIIYCPDHQSAFYYDQETRTLLITGKPEDYKSGQVLAYLGFWVMEAQRQVESMYTIHSSALAIEGKGVLLLGHSGAGKTSILFGLGNRYNCEVISNDLTIVAHNPNTRSMALIDGTKEIPLRLASVKARLPHLVDLFPDNGQSPWETKVVVSPEMIGMKSATGPRTLESAFAIHLDVHESDSLLIHKTEGIAIRYTLYEDMSRIIRGNAISLFGVNNNILGYTPSLDNLDLHQKRVAAIECLLNEIGVWSVSGGNLNQICEAIYELTLKG